MANPRQRNKARSGKSTKPSQAAIRRMHHKLRKAPPMKGPAVLAANWDKTKTVFQNYAALGLLSSIPVPSGPSSSRTHRTTLPFLPDHMKSSTSQKTDESSLIVGYGRIIRDEQGNVVDIVLPEDEASQDGDIAMEDDDEEEEEKEERVVEGKTDVVRSLESLAASAQPIKRHTSSSERTWLQNLVAAHGEDYAAMALDRRGNVWQKTQGEIKRMVRKAGGREKLLA
ncbi:ribosomal large subunit biogenesis-related protein [Naematelia encephala]|uniref:Nucleolar protein 16 n=1 Tax=Naematelia encephala TaxID=71784 RepID=A0A1Y2BKN2_9TREE|nr:ribosomal large subunit biogenesis-related protein [Naematelia encephala]